MKPETKENIIVGFWATVIILFCITALFWYFPIKGNDVNCYKEIATEICKNEELTFKNETFIINGFFISIDNYECCKDKPTVLSRKVIDNYVSCYEYIFLEEEHKKCSKKWHHFKRIW